MDGQCAIEELRCISEGLASKTSLKASAKEQISVIIRILKVQVIKLSINSLQDAGVVSQLKTAEDPYSEDAKKLLLPKKIELISDMIGILTYICGNQILSNDSSASRNIFVIMCLQMQKYRNFCFMHCL
jgi:hypothetical protein